MAITNGYATLAEYRDWLQLGQALAGSTPSTDDDMRMGRDIEAASRMVDQFTGRRFYSTSADETRYYSAVMTDLLHVDDLLSVTTLKTDEDGDRTFEITWATTDYVLEPYNATLEGRPYTRVRVDEYGGRYWFPTGDYKGVQIVGKFGYNATASIPVKVKEATLLCANRLGKRPGSPFGVAGASEFGQLVMLKDGMDPDAALLLREFIRMV